MPRPPLLPTLPPMRPVVTEDFDKPKIMSDPMTAREEQLHTSYKVFNFTMHVNSQVQAHHAFLDQDLIRSLLRNSSFRRYPSLEVGGLGFGVGVMVFIPCNE